MKVFITRVIPQAGKDLLLAAGFTIEEWTEKRNLTPAELIAHCSDADALLSAGSNKIDAAFLDAATHLKVIALHAVGYDNVDIAAATKHGIPVGNTPGVLTSATADTAFLLMLATSRKAFYLHKRIIRGEWNFFEPTANLGISLEGKTLGIFGMGSIGQTMARRCKAAYGMKIIYHNRRRDATTEAELGAEYVDFNTLLQQSDVLSVHAPLTPETEGKFNAAAFAQMKSTAIFVNTARGSLHNEPDLIAALEGGQIWGAGLDVTNPEPMHPDNILLQMPNVCVLPHIGSATQETRDAMAILAARNIIAGLRGERLPAVVNGEVYE